jgi:carbon-monoxide dehydrogenase iron sulfur subunit
MALTETERVVKLKRLYVRPRLCIGCRTCEVACVFVHSGGATRLQRSRVRVQEMGDNLFVPVLCLQCEEAACVKACPVEALRRNPETQAIEVVEPRCVRCMACIPACPFGNMTWDESAGVVVKCDVCAGRPACALFCPTRALEYR